VFIKLLQLPLGKINTPASRHFYPSLRLGLWGSINSSIMKYALALILACCALVGLGGCASGTGRITLEERQIMEAKAALSNGEITMSEYLKLKQQAEQAASLRRES
jgi:hypothetical protein